LATIIAVITLSCAQGGARVGLEAPPLELPRLGGGRVGLDSLKGKVVIVNFWATWCEPCREEMPSLEKLYRKMEGKPFELLAVSVDDRKDDVSETAREMNLSFPILLDPGGSIARTWGTVMFPETYIIGPDGVIRDKILGGRDWTGDEMISRLSKLMPAQK